MTLTTCARRSRAGPPAALAKRVVPNYPGHMPPILPAAWLEPLRGDAS